MRDENEVLVQPGPAAPVAVSRRRLLRGAVATAGITGAGLVASRWVRSPQQLAAEAEPPAPTTLTATVERRVLRDTVVLRGQVGAGRTIEVTPAPAEDDRPVITDTRAAVGQEVNAGSVLVEVTGRPVMALPGDIPAYRDLVPGASGRDVAQLQRALTDLGFPSGETDGVLGPGTKGALRTYYESVGYPPATSGDPGTVAAGRDRLRTAQRALAEARGDLDRARAGTATPAVDAQGGGDVRAAEQRARYAAEDVEAARVTLADLERTSGPMLPRSEVVFLPSFPARVMQTKAVLGGEVSAPLITLACGELVVRARLDPAQRPLLEPGRPVEIISEVLGTRAKGVVTSIGDLELEPAASTRSHALVVGAAGEAFPAALAGQDVRVVVEAASTAGEELVVPVTAVFTGGDGQATVTRLHADGRQDRMAVTVGVSGDGYLAVTPTSGELRPGDRVVTGVARAGNGTR